MSDFAKKCSNCKNYEGNIRICESCAHYDPPITVFNHITASPEALAPKLVFCAEYKTIRPMYLEGKGGIIVGEVWKSTVIDGASFKTEAEAIAATVARLKELEK